MYLSCLIYWHKPQNVQSFNRTVVEALRRSFQMFHCWPRWSSQEPVVMCLCLLMCGEVVHALLLRPLSAALDDALLFLGLKLWLHQTMFLSLRPVNSSLSRVTIKLFPRRHFICCKCGSWSCWTRVFFLDWHRLSPWLHRARWQEHPWVCPEHPH